MTDYSRFTPRQIRDHVAFNQRSVRLQPELFDRAQRLSFERTSLQRQNLDAEIRAFHQWRIGYVAREHGPITASEADAEEAVHMACRAMERLQRTWNAVMKFDLINDAPGSNQA